MYSRSKLCEPGFNCKCDSANCVVSNLVESMKTRHRNDELATMKCECLQYHGGLNETQFSCSGTIVVVGWIRLYR
jgi:hypothetical protein